jgi:hypothetical protein
VEGVFGGNAPKTILTSGERIFGGGLTGKMAARCAAAAILHLIIPLHLSTQG